MAGSAEPVTYIEIIPSSHNENDIVINQGKEEEEEIPCRLCKKKFASDIALRNHAKLQHTDAFCNGDESLWRVMPKKPFVPAVPKVKKEKKKNEIDEKLMEIKTNEIISSMAPVNLTSLAYQDVSYILIKSEKEYTPVVKKKKPKKQKYKKEKPESCTGKRTKKAVVREQHISASGPFECLQPSEASVDGLCHEIFFSCCLYSEHFRDEHTKRQKQLRCQVCEKPLQHQLMYDDCPYTCRVCDEQFATRADLSYHTEQAHEEVKPFQCVVCQKRFTQQGAMKQHMRNHTGDRPFPCTYCPKSFTQKSGLELHLRIHTKEKPFRCVICGRTFCQSVHLKQHMRIHTNLAPFQCGICQKRFKQRSHLNYHSKCHNNMSEEQKEKYEQLMGSDDTGVVEIEIEESQIEQSIEYIEDVESITYSEPNGEQWVGESCEVTYDEVQ